MIANDLLDNINKIFGDCLMLAEHKNNDYATGEDALANLRLFGFTGVAVRLSDKLMRLINFAKGKKLQVNDEKIKDTLKDIINYAAIAIVMLGEEEKEK